MIVVVCKVKRGVILPREGFGAAWGHSSNYSVQMAQLGANGTTGGSVNDPGGLHLIAFNRQRSRMSAYTYARRNGNGRRARY